MSTTEVDERDALEQSAPTRAQAPRPSDPHEALTTRELAVLALLPTRLTLQEIAQQVFVSVNTVKTQAGSIHRKLDATSRNDAIARAERFGLL